MLLDPCCFLHSSGTGPLYCQQHFPWPSATTWEWEETTYNGLITKQGHETLEQGEECVKEELCYIPAGPHKVGDKIAALFFEVTGLILTRIRITAAEGCRFCGFLEEQAKFQNDFIFLYIHKQNSQINDFHIIQLA